MFVDEEESMQKKRRAELAGKSLYLLPIHLSIILTLLCDSGSLSSYLKRSAAALPSL